MKQWLGGGWRYRGIELPYPENDRSKSGPRVVEVLGQLQNGLCKERVQFGR